MTYIFSQLIQNSLFYNKNLRRLICSKIVKCVNFVQYIVDLFSLVPTEYEKLAITYSTISTQHHEKKFANHPLFFEVTSPSDTTQKTFFNTELVNKMRKMVDWFEPYLVPQYSVISVRREKLIQNSKVVGYRGLLWPFLRFQWQRWTCFHAHWGNLLLKRLLDIIVSITVLVLLSPLLLLTALLIYFDSPGPIFFSQKRVGKQGRLFTMWKFRSMHVDAEKHKAVLMKKNEMSDGVLFKMKNDPRITRVGKFIRKFSIDEIPQLFNVLVGEMSLVGPRPPLPNEVAKYTPYHRQRLEVTPGITCFWQISGRNEIPFPKQVELDIYYITTQSFLGDIKLLFKTVPAVIKGHGAY